MTQKYQELETMLSSLKQESIVTSELRKEIDETFAHYHGIGDPLKLDVSDLDPSNDYGMMSMKLMQHALFEKKDVMLAETFREESIHPSELVHKAFFPGISGEASHCNDIEDAVSTLKKSDNYEHQWQHLLFRLFASKMVNDCPDAVNQKAINAFPDIAFSPDHIQAFTGNVECPYHGLLDQAMLHRPFVKHVLSHHAGIDQHYDDMCGGYSFRDALARFEAQEEPTSLPTPSYEL